MTDPLGFPPLMYGEEVPADAFAHACMKATMGCDAGMVAYAFGQNRMEAALIFAPEVPLRRAMAMLPLCGVGFQNALGALAPPEVAVHLGWDGTIYLNGARCGGFRAMASDPDPDAVPDWLVIGLALPLWPETDSPGDTPDQTTLYGEGCPDVMPPHLVEAWARHTLHHLNTWEQDGPRALHSDWRALAQAMGETVTQGALTGSFLGVDEDFAMLLRDAAGDTHLIPLTTLLEQP
ncbi:hypothetical protein AL036_05525 [Salipiger aestuarii]|jgi:biotin-(acetyl-CoA carboxylase) ligase|uniref:Biotin-(Acetyl-CoA carboxylase) ligase n=1 Tax=Salipiger aestuarii TaxID=568098 RepID=A0A327YN57_9RHOB|nr:biotin/lipoate--protein ligase family protein [Salipiger aestuarii]EIE49583.1 hypothetical protein C357_18117 [Citreicella sp. 357]KAA8608873.1 hypothetical protein AL036_05525 [Salipiger aestuarii]KAA8613177.1 hypothetical protein AL037_05490 [Salipiger aestuarii]KAB2543071.1 hypothetical protein AL035_04265 [Salipiger aestuarii]RAK19659.1 biotin-(acetyl-CoA carboxylase) ligase [Salipiger aestuarii]